MEKQAFDKLFEMSEVYYLPKGYHTPEHRLQVINNARTLGALALKSGHEFDHEVLDLSAAWHDAGLAHNPKDFFFEGGYLNPNYSPDCAERLSAMLFKQQATKLDVPSDLTREVFWTIMATNPDMRMDTTEAKLLAAADIRAVGLGSFKEFKDNTFLLWQEAQMKLGETVDWQKFVAGSINYLGKFTARKIHLTPSYFNKEGNSAWHVGAVSNIIQLAMETWPRVDVSSSLSQELEDPYGKEEIGIVARSDDGQKYEMLVKVPLDKTPIINNS